MKRIELIGLSGVGKTTLYNKIVNIPVDNRPYLTLKEAYKKGALNQDISLKQMKLWLYQIVLKFNLYESKAWGIGKTILHSVKKEHVKRKDFEPFIVSYLILLNFLKDSNDYGLVYKRVTSFLKKIEEYMILKSSLTNNIPVLVDEGVVHKHPGITQYGLKNYSAADLHDDFTFNPAGLINCEQTEDVIFQQAMKRKKNGIHTFTHGSMNRTELKNHIKKSMKRYKKKVSYFEEIGVPILHIDTGDAFEKNVQKINSFTQSIISDDKTLNYLEN